MSKLTKKDLIVNTNRTVYCDLPTIITLDQNILSKSQVYIDELFCGKIQYKEGVNPYTIECGSHLARLITVVGGAVDGYMTLCEVEVFSSNPPGLPSLCF
jgi:hypothetical protein